MVGEPAAHDLVQGIAVYPGQQASDRRFRRQEPLGKQRIALHADGFQHLWRGVGDPLTDRQQRSRPGQYRARGEREHDDEGVSHSARVGHLGQPLQQARRFCGCDPWMIAELVKGGWDR